MRLSSMHVTDIDTNAFRATHSSMCICRVGNPCRESVLCDEIDRLRARLVDAHDEVWNMINRETVWAADTRELRRILSDD